MSGSSSSSSSTAGSVTDSSVESTHIAAIIVCTLIGLTALCYVIYRLTQRYCPNMLLAITPQDTTRPLARATSQQHDEYGTRAAEMASHMAADSKTQQLVDKKGDSHTLDMPAASPLSVNEQWTVRDAPAEDEDTA